MIHNFSAGPSKVYTEVLEYAKTHFVDFESHGYSLLEMSHRGKVYETVHTKATELLHSLLGLDNEHHVLLLGGGASLQFSMIPLNIVSGFNDTSTEKSETALMSAGYIVTGAWGQKAYKEAKKVYPSVDILYSGEEHRFTQLPTVEQLSSQIRDDTYAYIHITSNETIHGIQWQEEQALSCALQQKSSTLVADMSSDILSRHIDANCYDIVYAGAQKNLGVAGVTVVVVSNDVLKASAHKVLPAYLSYDTHYKSRSLYNTPPVGAIWILSLVLEHIVSLGGISEVEKRNKEKAAMLYKYIDESDGFYHCAVQKPYRSTMNVVFTLPNDSLEQQFLAYAEQNKMYGLKGHRSVGGCRASLYNAVSIDDVEALVTCMKQFKAKSEQHV